MTIFHVRKTGLLIPAFVFLFASVVIRTGMTQDDSYGDPDRPALRIGLSTGVVESDVNPNDVLGATQVWLSKIKDKSWGDTQSMLYTDFEKTKEQLDKAELDLIVLETYDYLQSTETLTVDPLFTYMYAGEVDLEYVLLVRKDSGIETAKDLAGKRLALLDNGRYSLASLWLDVYLMRNQTMGEGIRPREVKVVNKASQAILPVFFNQLDAAVVLRSALDVSSDLNPQIGLQLKVLAVSPRFVPVVVCLRKGMSQPQKSGLVRNALRLHETPGGLQTFTVFKMDRFIPWKKEYETNVINLIDEYKKLKTKVNKSVVLQTEAMK